MKVSLIFSTILLASIGSAQSGGPYQITQSVIAGGGGGPSTGGTFGLGGTMGQSNAGDNSTGGSFGVRSGFWQFELAPSAATVSVSGRVTTVEGEGLRNAFVTMTKADGTPVTARSSSFGYFRFDEMELGSYVLTVSSKRFTFAPRVITLTDELSGLEIIAQP